MRHAQMACYLPWLALAAGQAGTWSRTLCFACSLYSSRSAHRWRDRAGRRLATCKQSGRMAHAPCEWGPWQAMQAWLHICGQADQGQIWPIQRLIQSQPQARRTLRSEIVKTYGSLPEASWATSASASLSGGAALTAGMGTAGSAGARPGMKPALLTLLRGCDDMSLAVQSACQGPQQCMQGLVSLLGLGGPHHHRARVSRWLCVRQK